MATKADKKNTIRQGIIEAAIVYSQNLAGKTFLYVYVDEYFEVSFPVDHFLHLTGVETRLMIFSCQCLCESRIHLLKKVTMEKS